MALVIVIQQTNRVLLDKRNNKTRCANKQRKNGDK